MQSDGGILIGVVVALLFGLVAGVNVLWYWCKFTLRSNGCSVAWFTHHLRDLDSMRRLISNEADPALVVRYRLLLYSLYAAIGLLVLCLLLLLALVSQAT